MTPFGITHSNFTGILVLGNVPGVVSVILRIAILILYRLVTDRRTERQTHNDSASA